MSRYRDAWHSGQWRLPESSCRQTLVIEEQSGAEGRVDMRRSDTRRSREHQKKVARVSRALSKLVFLPNASASHCFSSSRLVAVSRQIRERRVCAAIQPLERVRGRRTKVLQPPLGAHSQRVVQPQSAVQVRTHAAIVIWKPMEGEGGNIAVDLRCTTNRRVQRSMDSEGLEDFALETFVSPTLL